ncbi:MAG: FeoB-associated Cys-rich membrane protein [Lachnospiraceae bacterium]
MIQWIIDNLATIIVSVLLLMAVVSAVVFMAGKKKNDGGCSHGCSGCSMSAECPSSRELSPGYDLQRRRDETIKKNNA